MNEGWKRFHGTDEEVMWRIQVLKRTSRLCAAKAKELERSQVATERNRLEKELADQATRHAEQDR